MQNSWGLVKKDYEENLICKDLKGRLRFVKSLENKKYICIKLDGEIKPIHYQRVKKGKKTEESNTTNGLELIYILNAIKNYKGSSLNKNLFSYDPLLRFLAILDKRITPLMLEKIKDDIQKQPEWLQFFYKLRFDMEKVSYPKEVVEEVIDKKVDLQVPVEEVI